MVWGNIRCHVPYPNWTLRAPSGRFVGLHTELSTTVFHIAVLHYSNFLPRALPSLSKQSKSHPQKCRSLPVTLTPTLHRKLLLLPWAAALRLSWHVSQGGKPPASGHRTASLGFFGFISYNSSSSSSEVQWPERFHVHPM